MKGDGKKKKERKEKGTFKNIIKTRKEVVLV